MRSWRISGRAGKAPQRCRFWRLPPLVSTIRAPVRANGNIMKDLLRLQRRAVHVLVGLLALAAGSAAFAQDAQEMSRLIRLGQYGPASERIEAALAKNPKDPQARFLKGVLQTEQ